MRCTTVVFISGRGSNLEALLKNQEHFTVSCILSNKPSAAGLLFGEEYQIETFVTGKKTYASLSQQKEQLYKKVSQINPDYILLAGYMQIIAPHFIEDFQGRILNVHPSLLPNFPGLNPHQQALDAGTMTHGCTVHLVTAEVDSGPIVAQATCPVHPTDSGETLAARVLPLEHQLYPWVINALGTGDISISSDGAIHYSQKAIDAAHEKNFILSITNE